MEDNIGPWDEIDNKLTKEFVFKNFVSAVSFVTDVADVAEEAQHHPDIFIYDYNKVMIQLITHDAEAITDKDENLATEIDELV